MKPIRLWNKEKETSKKDFVSYPKKDNQVSNMGASPIRLWNQPKKGKWGDVIYNTGWDKVEMTPEMEKLKSAGFAPLPPKTMPKTPLEYTISKGIPQSEIRQGYFETKKETPEEYRKRVMELEKSRTEYLIEKGEFKNITLNRHTKNFIVGIGGTVEGMIGAGQWIAPDKMKPFFKEKGDQIELWQKLMIPEDRTFVDDLITGAGSAATFFIPGIGVAKAATTIAKISPKLALLFGNVVATALESATEAGSVYREKINTGADEKEASWGATKTFVANSFLIGLTNKFGAFSDATESVLKRMVLSAPMEGIQEYFQEVIQNVNTGKPAFENAFRSGMIGAILGIPMGGISGISFDNLSTTEQQKIIEQELLKKIQGVEMPAGLSIKEVGPEGKPIRLWKKGEVAPKTPSKLTEGVKKEITTEKGVISKEEQLGFIKSKTQLNPLVTTFDVKIGEGTIGKIGFRKENRREIYLADINIESKLRQQGIGTKIIDKLFKDNPQVERIEFDVPKIIPPFWKKIGAEIIGVEKMELTKSAFYKTQPVKEVKATLPTIKKVLGEKPAPFIKKRETTLLKDRIKNIIKGFGEGRITTKKEISATQTQLLDIIDKSKLELSDKAKFRRAVKNIQTTEQLKKSLPEIQERIEELEKKASKRTIKTKIKKELKQTKIRKQAGKPVGKYTPEVQKTLEKIRRASLVTKSEAEAIIDGNLKEYKDSIPPDDVALENKVLSMIAGMDEMSVSELQNILRQIQTIKETGKLTAELQKFNRQEKIDRWTNKAIDIITGQKGLPKGISTIGTAELSPTTLKERVLKFMRGIGKGFVGWNDIIDMVSALDKTTKPGESWLDEFADVMSEKNATKKAERINSEKFRKMAEETLNVKNDREMVRRFRDDAQEVSLGIFKNAQGEEVEIKFTKSEARKRWIEFQDPTLQESFKEGMGYTDEITNAITDFLTTEDIAFAKAQMEFYKEYYKGVNKIYGEIYGVDLPQNEYYSPIKREGIERDESVGFGEFLQEISVRKSVTSGSLKSRVRNIKPLHKQSDIAILEQHLAEMEHFKNWANKIRDLKSVFGNPQVRTAIIREHGKDMLAMVDNFLNDFTRGGIETASRLSGLDKLRGNFNRAILAGKISIGVKQLTSFVAYADTIPVEQFGLGVASFWANPIDRIRILRQSEMMKARGKYMERDVKTAMKSDAYASFRKHPSFLNSLMLNVMIGDQGAIYVGGWSVYKYNRKMGKTHAEALRMFEKVTSNTQQSADLDKQSYWQRGGSWAKLFTMFKSAPNQFFRKELGAVRNVVHGKITVKQAAKTIVIYQFLLPMLFQFVSDFFRWDPEEQKRAAILGPFNGIFIVGDGLDYLIRTALGMRAFDAEIPIYSIKDDIGKAVKLIQDNDITTEDVFKAIRGLMGATGALTGKPLKQAVDITAGFSDVLSGEYEKGLGRIFGWSEYIIDKGKSSNLKDKTLKGSTLKGKTLKGKTLK